MLYWYVAGHWVNFKDKKKNTSVSIFLSILHTFVLSTYHTLILIDVNMLHHAVHHTVILAGVVWHIHGGIIKTQALFVLFKALIYTCKAL